MSLEEEVFRSLEEGNKYLIAVSGGADSVSLLDAVCNLREARNIELAVAHVNHALRKESSRDEDFVRSLAAARSIPIHVHIAKDPPSKNIEAWARATRYKFFSHVLAEHRLDWIMTAHTADDLLETFLMRLIANKEPRLILGTDKRRRLLRPLLKVWREEIEGYIKKNSLSFVIDDTNTDVRFFRNKIRHQVLPVLQEQFDQDIKTILLNRAYATIEDQEVLSEICARSVKRINEIAWGTREWFKALKLECDEAHPGVRWRIIDELFLPHIGYRLGRAVATRVLEFVKGNGSRIELPGRWVVSRKEGGLVVTQPS